MAKENQTRIDDLTKDIIRARKIAQGKGNDEESKKTEMVTETVQKAPEKFSNLYAKNLAKLTADLINEGHLEYLPTALNSLNNALVKSLAEDSEFEYDTFLKKYIKKIETEKEQKEIQIKTEQEKQQKLQAEEEAKKKAEADSETQDPPKRPQAGALTDIDSKKRQDEENILREKIKKLQQNGATPSDREYRETYDKLINLTLGL